MVITKSYDFNPRYGEFYEIDDDVKTDSNMYHIGERIGVGGNAAVYSCVDSKGNEYAIKFLLNFGTKINKRFAREVKILKRLSHPHIVRFIDEGTTAATTSKKSSHIVKVYFAVMERADKNLVDFIKENSDKIEYEIYAPQLRGLSEALCYLHEIAIHRDIKPENILVKGEKWLISDFGLCSIFKSDDEMELTGDYEKVGPKWWMSPEAAVKAYWGQDEIDEASDVYQLCAVFWFIITRKCPIGTIVRDDYLEFDTKVCDTILQALYYCKIKRPQNGRELFNSICAATIDRDA